MPLRKNILIVNSVLRSQRKMISIIVTIIIIAIIWLVAHFLIKKGNNGWNTVSYAFLISLITLMGTVMYERTLLYQLSSLKNEKAELMTEYNYFINKNETTSKIKEEIKEHNNKCNKFYNDFQKDWWVDLILYSSESANEYAIRIEE